MYFETIVQVLMQKSSLLLTVSSLVFLMLTIPLALFMIPLKNILVLKEFVSEKLLINNLV